MGCILCRGAGALPVWRAECIGARQYANGAGGRRVSKTIRVVGTRSEDAGRGRTRTMTSLQSTSRCTLHGADNTTRSKQAYSRLGPSHGRSNVSALIALCRISSRLGVADACRERRRRVSDGRSWCMRCREGGGLVSSGGDSPAAGDIQNAGARHACVRGEDARRAERRV